MTRLSISVAGDVVVALDWKLADVWRRVTWKGRGPRSVWPGSDIYFVEAIDFAEALGLGEVTFR